MKAMVEAYERGAGSTVEGFVDTRADGAANPLAGLRRLLNIAMSRPRR